MARKQGHIASLINGFGQGYDTTNRVLRDIDIAKISAAQQESSQGQIDPAAAAADPGATAPTVAKFLGQTYDKPLDDAGMSKARSLAMAGVLEKYGDVAGGQGMRERIAAQALNEERAARERELYPLQRRQVELGVSTSERADRTGKKAEAKSDSLDALNKDVGEWMKSRLTGPDGTQRAATPDDYLATTQYRANKLVESGNVDEAVKAMSEHNAAALGKIHLDTAQRNEAIGRTVAALGAGDLGAVKDFYNKFVPDGAQVTDVKRGPNGQIVIQRASADGRPMPPTTLQDVNQVAATLSSFKDPMALYQWSQGEFNRTMQQKQLAVSQGHLGLAGQAAARAQAEFDAGAPDRETKGKIAKLKGELADVDDSTPDGKKRAEQIQGKLQALATGTRGAGVVHDPASVATARALVAAGTYPDMATALEGVVSKPDQQHKTFVDTGLKNMQKPEEAVKNADKVMASMGWVRNGARWSKAAGAAAAPAGAPQKGAVVDGHVFQGGNPNDPASWKKQ